MYDLQRVSGESCNNSCNFLTSLVAIFVLFFGSKVFFYKFVHLMFKIDQLQACVTFFALEV